MAKKVFFIALASLLMAGCGIGSADKLADLEAKSTVMEGRLDSLEEKLDLISQKQLEIEKSYEALTTQKKGASDTVPLAAQTMTDKDIQIALRNAGFYNGSIDGKIGPNTKKAVEEFQKAHKLKPDGIIGAKTKSLLAEYLEGAQD